MRSAWVASIASPNRFAPSSGRSPDMVLIFALRRRKLRRSVTSHGCVRLGQLRTLQVLVGMYPRESTPGLPIPVPRHSGMRVPAPPPGRRTGDSPLIEPRGRARLRKLHGAPLFTRPAAGREPKDARPASTVKPSRSAPQPSFSAASRTPIAAFEGLRSLAPWRPARRDVMLRRSLRDSRKPLGV